MIDKRYNIRPNSNANSYDRKMEKIIKDFKLRQPTLVERLDDQKLSLSPSSRTSSSGSQSNIRSFKSDISSSHKQRLPNKPKRKVTWTPSTRLGSQEAIGPRRSESVTSARENLENANVSDADDSLAVTALADDIRVSNTDRRRSRAIQILPEEYLEMGLGRIENRFSIVK